MNTRLESESIQGYDFDCKLIQDFERGLNLCSPEKSLIPCRVLGYGEISTVIEIQLEDLSGLAFKRMSIFESEDEIGDYIQLYQEYNRILEQDIGLGLPPHGYFVCESKSHRPIVYIIQKQVPYHSLGNKAMNLLQPEQAVVLFRCVLGELLRVWEYNQRSYDRQIAIDGQISNWAVDDFDPKNPIFDGDCHLLYLDTSSPFLRLKQVEQLDAELFLRAAPSFMVWILRLLFLKDVMTRYYEPRKVTIDLLANVYKEQRSDLIPALLAMANKFFASEAEELGISPLLEKEVQDYYREDAMIWSLYLSMRRFDRYLHQEILHHEYPYILPGIIKR